MSVSFHELDHIDDDRGFMVFTQSIAYKLLGEIKETHIVSLKKGICRGNHFHKQKDEVLIAYYKNDWTFAFQTKDDTIKYRQFKGSGAVLIFIPRLITHALRNDKALELIAISMANAEYNSSVPDTYAFKIL